LPFRRRKGRALLPRPSRLKGRGPRVRLADDPARSLIPRRLRQCSDDSCRRSVGCRLGAGSREDGRWWGESLPLCPPEARSPLRFQAKRLQGLRRSHPLHFQREGRGNACPWESRPLACSGAGRIFDPMAGNEPTSTGGVERPQARARLPERGIRRSPGLSLLCFGMGGEERPEDGGPGL
jgi:hypothetical protein